jgi:hypothetical protein
MSYPTPCKHTAGRSLCRGCRAEFAEDPDAWEEYGYHPRGEANFAAVLADIAAMPVSPMGDEDLPY